MLTRTAFTTSRLLEFCTAAELTKLVGFDSDNWPLVAAVLSGVQRVVDRLLDARDWLPFCTRDRFCSCSILGSRRT
jgi:hypothetical protein